jgi:hypothetical protein
MGMLDQVHDNKRQRALLANTLPVHAAVMPRRAERREDEEDLEP